MSIPRFFSYANVNVNLQFASDFSRTEVHFSWFNFEGWHKYIQGCHLIIQKAQFGQYNIECRILSPQTYNTGYSVWRVRHGQTSLYSDVLESKLRDLDGRLRRQGYKNCLFLDRLESMIS